MSYLKQRCNSFKYAFQGIRTLFAETPNALIHLILAILAIILGWVLKISRGEWLTIVLVIGFVFAMEALNSAIEMLADYACKKEIHPAIKKIKDMAAAGVLLAAITALAAGFLIFLPKIMAL